MELISKIAKDLAPRYKFGSYTVDDIEQECYILALEALEKYDNVRPLENFLRTHLRRRLCNLRRDLFYRKESSLAEQKKAILQPLDLADIDDEEEPNLVVNVNILEDITRDEIIDYINEKLEASFRSDFLKVLAGVKISNFRSVNLKRRIIEIVTEYESHG